MASLMSDVARKRKSDLRQLKIYSRKLDASQEKLEREITRLINRKRAVPELSDYQRLATMVGVVDQSLATMANAIYNMSLSWTTY